MATKLKQFVQEGIDLHSQIEAIQKKIWRINDELKDIQNTTDDAFIDEEIYVINECGKDPVTKKTSEHTKPKSIIISLLGFGAALLVLVFTVVMFVIGVRNAEQRKIFQELKSEPGVGYT